VKKKVSINHVFLNLTSEEIEDIKGTYDFIGVNHYSTSLVQWIEDYEIGEPSSIKDVSAEVYDDDSWETSAFGLAKSKLTVA
jgi:beta-glucosidase/6-phospho-beta-glucosidase/beta-galactosidase